MQLKKKLQKATWFALIRVVAQMHPRTGTRLSLAFFRRTDMNLVGNPTFIACNAWFDGTQNYGLITLHEGSCISRDVRVLTHDWSAFTVFRAFGRTSTIPVGRRSKVEIGADSFVGLGAILMPGTRIGRGAIVGAGAVVRGEVPDFAIVVGNPGEVVGDTRTLLSRNYPNEWGAFVGPVDGPTARPGAASEA